MRRWIDVALLAVGGVAVLAVAVAAAVADAETFAGRPWQSVIDIGVGAAFIVGPVVASGPGGERMLVAAVGVTWLIGSFDAPALSLHQAVLLVMLLSFPSGRPDWRREWPCGPAAVALATERVPQLGVVAVFVLAAVMRVLRRRERGAALYPAASAAVVSAGIAYSWWAAQHPAATYQPVVYQTALLAVAAGYPIATRVLRRHHADLAHRVLGTGAMTGIAGLQMVLGDAVGDPNLRIRRMTTTADSIALTPTSATVTVLAGDRLLALIWTTSPAVEDGETRTAMESAVRLAVLNQELVEAQSRQLAVLEASRGRLVAAADREQQEIARELREVVSGPLRQALADLDVAKLHPDPGVRELLDIADEQAGSAASQMRRLIRGVPPIALGQEGQLSGALAALAAASPTSVRISVDSDAQAEPVAEAALYYACAEALTNAIKHSGASGADLTLRRRGDLLELAVTDHGRGGADPNGSGLQGLADRMTAVGGRLVVRSPVGVGTTVTAVLPAISAPQLTGRSSAPPVRPAPDEPPQPA